MSPERIKVVLSQLEVLLAEGDTAANGLWADAYQNLLPVVGEPLEQMHRQMESFDYPAALETAGELLRQVKS